ncbi:hypothetical protein BO78DRAFT_374960 [Aspergillus sclerotiicarbonarius CBS 121057]|uniref:MYND-type zinc finger protein samB n=1 Tax=Aspergillus sclerotiicarbonarius (strain CBS 121057 / IBT 28362) TaxID=1448318 RepID=A0A319E9Z1_ASPSB|nr:hypothetical protein BO78DRAFT_374960 [Aspergillus sclerotiicarbonarius CBS 121057]
MSRNYVSLDDKEAFPNFADLPCDYTCPLARRGINGCLLVEIVSIERSTRVVLRTYDRAKFPVTVALYTGDRGRTITNCSELKPGNTLLFMFPRQHFFVDGSVGIRQEEYRSIKIFSMSLAELFQLSKEMATWPANFAMHTACHGCGKKDIPLLKCARCGVFAYCGKVRALEVSTILAGH